MHPQGISNIEQGMSNDEVFSFAISQPLLSVKKNPAEAIQLRFAVYDGVMLKLPKRGAMCKPPEFSR
jgi:hypothetical protein